MIFLGLNTKEKKELIQKYLNTHENIKHVIYFTGKGKEFPDESEEYTWEDIIMYKVFYPLLEKIDDSYLLVLNEILRTGKRSDLTYNCLHHYLNQTSNKIIFSYFPIIDNANDFMILADLEYVARYKGRSYSPEIMQDLHIDGVRQNPVIIINEVEIPVKAFGLYETQKEKLFENLGNKDPDTIPRQLHLWAGKWKKPYVESSKSYVARNSRFSLDNVTTYKNAVIRDCISIDIPHKRIEMNDYLYRTQAKEVVYLSTPLKVDRYYGQELMFWSEKVNKLYAEAGIY